MRVEGLEEEIEDINDKVAEIKNAAQAGFWEAALKILNKAQKNLKASVVTGNLRASGYVRSPSDFVRPDPEKLSPENNEPVPSDSFGDIGAEIGFTANYALYVHENMQGRSPKFLEEVITKNKRQIVEIIKKRSGGE